MDILILDLIVTTLFVKIVKKRMVEGKSIGILAKVIKYGNKVSLRK